MKIQTFFQTRTLAILFAVFLLSGNTTKAENGRQLWLRMEKNTEKANVIAEKKLLRSQVVKTAIQELQEYWHAPEKVMLTIEGNGTPEAYAISKREGGEYTVSASSDRGLLYGSYALLRLQEMKKLPASGESISSAPSSSLRMLNHGDNTDGTVGSG